MTADTLTTAQKMAGIRDYLETERGLIGRRTETHILQVAIVARLHVLLYGAPGVAKSMTVDSLLAHFPGMRRFKTQAYKVSPPEQFLGPISLRAMEADRFERITTGRVPDCEIAFIDELSRAPRSVLPAFQSMMVEREFDAGDGARPVPLMSMIGAVNHLLEDDTELAAFFDRFTLKLTVAGPPSQEQFGQIMSGALRRRRALDPMIPLDLIVDPDELRVFQFAADEVEVPNSVIDRLGELWANLSGAGITPSIRRYVDLTKAMQACAILDGRTEVIIDDMQIAMHSLWTAEAERAIVYREVVGFASDWVKRRAELLDALTETVERLGQIQGAIAAGGDATTRVEVNDREQSVRDHGITLVSEQRALAKAIENHVLDAAGQDTSELDAAVEQIDATRSWVSEHLLGGLSL